MFSRTYYRQLLLLIAFISLLSACTHNQKYRIGVSQCSNDTWRQKVNREIRIGQYQYDNVDIDILSADNDGKRQKRQIDSLIEQHIDLLIVAPSDINAVTSSLDKAYKKGIPVILYDRKSNSNNYTSYIGSDNKDVGRNIAEFIVSKLHGYGKVLEITGLKGSSPVSERHEGFMEVMNKYPGIYVMTAEGNWRGDMSEQIVGNLLDTGDKIDCVFGHNDVTAIGGYNAAKKRGVANKMFFVGIDGLPGKQEGIEFVKKGYLEGSLIYPTQGEEIVKLAMKILLKQPYRRINSLKSSMITKENVHIVDLQEQEMERQAKNLHHIYNKIDMYVKEANSQRIITILMSTFILLLGFLVFGAYRMIRIKEKTNRKIQEMSDAQMAFFMAASHDLRTPLTMIADPLDNIRNSKELKEANLHLLDIARRSVKTLRSLVDDIMDMRKIDAGKMQLQLSVFDLKQEITILFESFQPLFNTKHVRNKLTVGLQTDTNIIADKDKILRVIANLVVNALRYVPVEGMISIDIQEDKSGENLLITVHDNGKGISKEEQKNIFSPYIQVRNTIGGTGIGLTLVKGFVQLHHGDVTLDSNIGEGSTFVIRLPKKQEGIVEAVKADTPVVAPAASDYISDSSYKKNKVEEFLNTATSDTDTVLIVDDNNEVRAYLRTILSAKYRVIEAVDGEEGLAVAVDSVPDIIISDVIMPGMNGLEFCQKVKEKDATSHIPIILLTAMAQESQLIEGYKQGADDYITKPFSSAVLLARIDSLLANRKRLYHLFSYSDAESIEIETLGSRDKEFINKVNKAIRDNLSNPNLKVEDLGEAVGLSRAQLYRKIKALTGYNTIDLLRLARLERAKKLLITTNQTISEIAYSVGFTNPSYFSTCFRQQYGMQPNDMRKNQ